MKSLSLKTKLYHIMDVSHLMDMFKRNVNPFPSPSNWTDPWEKLDIKLEGGSKDFEKHKNSIFAQSWSTDHYSGLLWENYSKNGRGVRIKSSVGKIYGSLPTEIISEYETDDMISSVDYLSEKKIKKDIQDLIINRGVTLETVTKLFFKKREAYTAEKEVRVIIPFEEKYRSMKLKEKDGKRFLEFKLDPKDFIESIYFDTKMPKVEFEVFKSQLRDNYGFENPIQISRIHRKPRPKAITA